MSKKATVPVPKLKKKKRQALRTTVQAFFFVLIALIAVNHSLSEAGNGIPVLSAASMHALCPFGGVVSIYTFVTAGTFVQKIHESAFILMILGFITALIAGAAFCGWICPFGSFQEWIGKIGKKIFGRRYNRFIPYKIDRWLRYLRYGMLIWVVVVTAVTVKLYFSDFDPYFALFNFWTGEVALPGIIFLGAVIISALFVERPFCKYACPYGAVLGIFNTFRIFTIRRNKNTCIDCKACDRSCPMNIPVSESGKITHHQCITCLKCSSEQACPVENTVELTAGKYPETNEITAEVQHEY